jgi:hypothetical protein
MQTAGARILPEEDQQEMSREAVLLAWERKIEEAERRPGRFEGVGRASESDEEPRQIGLAAAPTEDATHDTPRRFQRGPDSERGPDFQRGPDAESPVGERRTITITGRPGPPARRRRSVVESQLAQPDRIALWAFLLGLFLVAVAAGTAHA